MAFFALIVMPVTHGYDACLAGGAGSSLISLLVCVVDDLYYQQGDFFQALNSGHSTRLKSFAITSLIWQYPSRANSLAL